MYRYRRSSFLLALLASGALAACSGAGASKDPPPHRGDGEGAALDRTPPSIPADAIKAEASDPQVRDFYAKAGWHALWSAADTAALDHAIGARVRHGLDRIDFGRVDASMSPAEQEVTRTRAAIAYASSLANGRVDPTTVHDHYTVPRPDGDVSARLLRALQVHGIAGYFAGLAPQDSGYRRLSDAYVSYRKQAGGEDAPTAGIADAETIHPGDRDPRLREVATDLAANGYLPRNAVPAAGDEAPPYGPALVQAVKHLQSDYGVKADGLLGDNTLAVLNFGPADKARALAVALERRRWLSRTPPATRIDVNTAAATLDYYRDGKLVDERRVIAGEPGRETPPLRAPIYRLVANPTWTVPKSISVSSATIRAKNMHRTNGFLVQPSGPDNALGLVKFDMKDDQQIYLHDTSNHDLFGRSQRHLSHGCVRVEDALGFAKMIAGQEGISARWQQARQSGDETFVPLPQPIPVRLLYQNVFVDRDGQIAFRTDPYGWNEAVAKQLGFVRGASTKAKAQDIDIGP